MVWRPWITVNMAEPGPIVTAASIGCSGYAKSDRKQSRNFRIKLREADAAIYIIRNPEKLGAIAAVLSL